MLDRIHVEPRGHFKFEHLIKDGRICSNRIVSL